MENVLSTRRIPETRLISSSTDTSRLKLENGLWDISETRYNKGNTDTSRFKLLPWHKINSLILQSLQHINANQQSNAKVINHLHQNTEKQTELINSRSSILICEFICIDFDLFI